MSLWTKGRSIIATMVEPVADLEVLAKLAEHDLLDDGSERPCIQPWIGRLSDPKPRAKRLTILP